MLPFPSRQSRPGDYRQTPGKLSEGCTKGMHLDGQVDLTASVKRQIVLLSLALYSIPVGFVQAPYWLSPKLFSCLFPLCSPLLLRPCLLSGFSEALP